MDVFSRRLSRKVGLARVALYADRAWPLAWLPLGVALIFIIAALAGGFALLGPAAHQIALAGFALAFALAFLPLLRLRWPARAEALRRLETKSGLPHRPASSYEDALPEGQATGETAAIWTAHRARLGALAARLKVGAPRPQTFLRDPLALRAPLLLVALVLAVARGGEAPGALAAALDPAAVGPSRDLRLDGWITPPAFTRRPPIVLATNASPAAGEEEGGALIVPEGSILTLRVNHPRAADFRLQFGETELLPAEGNAVTASFAEFTAKLSVPSQATLALEGTRYARWRITVEDDLPPAIALAEPPKQGQRGALRLKYRADDDFGVVSAAAAFALAQQGPDAETPLGDAPAFALALSKPGAPATDGQTYKELLSHPWAGLPVQMTLTATDGAGQTGRSEPAKFMLPARAFKHPLAKALVAERARLVLAPSERESVAAALAAITARPEEDGIAAGVFLGIRSAHWRLRNRAVPRDGLMSVVDQLWTIAVSLEDGALSEAEKALRDAQEALRNALDNDAGEAEIKAAMDKLREAMADFMAAMAQQQPQDATQPQPGNAQELSRQDLQQMMDKIEELAKQGAKDAARQMLAQMQEMLENAKAQQGQPSAQQRQQREQADALSDLMREQQQLMDETFRQQDGAGQPQQGQPQSGQRQQGQRQRGAPPSPGQGDMRQKMLDAETHRRARQEGQRGRQGQPQQGSEPQPGGQNGEPGEGEGQDGEAGFAELKQRQEALRQKLEELTRQMRQSGNEGGDKLGKAGESMQDAGEKLGEADAGSASQSQGQALDAMRQTAKEMAEGEGQQPGGEKPNGQQGGGRDPMGRPLPQQQFDAGDSVRVPGEIDVQKARAILDELRRRSGERLRPAEELDYIDRLITR